jgi:hypothetical protein
MILYCVEFSNKIICYENLVSIGEIINPEIYDFYESLGGWLLRTHCCISIKDCNKYLFVDGITPSYMNDEYVLLKDMVVNHKRMKKLKELNEYL